MKKLLYKLALPLLVLSLTGCGNNKTPIDPPKNDQGETENQPNDPSSKTEWTKEEKEQMKTYLNGFICPFIDIPGAEWIYSTYYETIAFRLPKCEDNQVICTFMDAFLNSNLGFVETSDQFDDHNMWNRYGMKMIDEEANEYIEIHATRWMKSREFYGVVTYHIDNSIWDEAGIKKAIKNVFNIDFNLPKPDFTFDDFYMIEQGPELGYNVRVQLFGGDYSAKYEKILAHSGLFKRDKEGPFFNNHYADPSRTVEIETFYNEFDECTDISIMGYHGLENWPEPTKSEIMKYTHGYALPYFDVGGGTWDYDEVLKCYFYLKPHAVLEDLELIEHTFINAGFVNATEEYLGDEYDRFFKFTIPHEYLNNFVEINAYIDVEDNLYVDIAYQSFDPVWHQDKVDEAINRKLHVSVSLPTPEFKFYDSSIYEDSEQEIVTINLYSEEDPTENYIATLKQNGYLDGVIKTSFYDPEKIIYVSTYYDSTFEEFSINVVAVSPLE